MLVERYVLKSQQTHTGVGGEKNTASINKLRPQWADFSPHTICFFMHNFIHKLNMSKAISNFHAMQRRRGPRENSPRLD